jgi:hypothetical protein
VKNPRNLKKQENLQKLGDKTSFGFLTDENGNQGRQFSNSEKVNSVLKGQFHQIFLCSKVFSDTRGN